ncbi:MAG: hypothetical protein PWP65_2011 [Clostridia bacterium]|nr:hypothetical protein [Clostridia bacterium]
MFEQMIIEHSEPGFVITLSDDLENTLRNLSWEQIEKLRQELVRLARQTSAECGRALEAFHIETPGEVGASIPSLATLENVDKACVEQVLERAREQFGWKFKLYMSCLLEGKYSRQDYVDNIKDAIMYGDYGDPVLPAELREHRRRLLEKEIPSAFKGLTVDHYLVGYRWVEEETKQVEKILKEIDSEVQAVGRYLLETITPPEKNQEELFYWCVFASQTGNDRFYQFYGALEEKVPYLHQKIHYCWQLYWTGRCFKNWLVEKMKEYINEARSIYIPEAIEALKGTLKEMRDEFSGLFADESGDETENREEGEES